MVPLHLLTPKYATTIIPVNINCQGPPLTPLSRAWAFGEALRRACDSVPERIAIIGTGGISHWPATPDSGRINEEWDRDFMKRWCANDREAMLSYSDEDIYRSEEHTSELQSLMRISYAVFCLKKKIICSSIHVTN